MIELTGLTDFVNSPEPLAKGAAKDDSFLSSQEFGSIIRENSS